MDSEAELSEAKVKQVPPRPIEEAEAGAKVFHVLNGASSSYWPRTSWARASGGHEIQTRKMQTMRQAPIFLIMERLSIVPVFGLICKLEAVML